MTLGPQFKLYKIKGECLMSSDSKPKIELVVTVVNVAKVKQLKENALQYQSSSSLAPPTFSLSMLRMPSITSEASIISWLEHSIK